MSDYTPLACRDYDVLELLCIDRAEIELTLGNGALVGTAPTLVADSSAEYLVVGIGGEATNRVRLDRIRHLVVRSRPARFETHTFGATP